MTPALFGSRAERPGYLAAVWARDARKHGPSRFLQSCRRDLVALLIATTSLALGAVACSDESGAGQSSPTTCLMPAADSGVWERCDPDAALRVHPKLFDGGDAGSSGPGKDGGVTRLSDDLDAEAPVKAATLRADGGAEPSGRASAGEATTMGEPLDPAGMLASEELAECPEQDLCPLPEYPCVPADEDAGFACRGQYAAWPMPDSDPQADPPPSYHVLADAGVVLDEVTGLMWQRGVPEVYAGCSGVNTPALGATCSWAEAKQYCEQLQLYDKRWRLPSLIELESLFDFSLGGDVRARFIDTDAFSLDDRMEFWTSTEHQILSSDRREVRGIVVFVLGLDGTSPTTEFHAVRCVRSERVHAVPPERYSDLNEGLVRDQVTGIVWQRGPAVAAATWDEALAYCESKGLRVPTIKQLISLSDLSYPAATPSAPETSPFEDPDRDSVLYSRTLGRDSLRLFYSPTLLQLMPQSYVDEASDSYAPRVRCVQ